MDNKNTVSKEGTSLKQTDLLKIYPSKRYVVQHIQLSDDISISECYLFQFLGSTYRTHITNSSNIINLYDSYCQTTPKTEERSKAFQELYEFIRDNARKIRVDVFKVGGNI